jgi:hypothetical protein
MGEKSLRELTLELIRSTHSFVDADLRHSSRRNAEKYEDAMNFIASSFYLIETFDEMHDIFLNLQAAFDFCGVDKYTWLAVEHCEDIFNSMNLRFVSGYEKQ